MKAKNWMQHVDQNGDFALPIFLYKTINNLMKTALDCGTLLSSDPAKLRAYKEMVKTSFKDKWSELADALEFYEWIIPCTCDPKEYCNICGGSRFLMNENLSPDEMKEVSVALSPDADSDVMEKLTKGLEKAISETRGSHFG